jgi:hypothetical protein
MKTYLVLVCALVSIACSGQTTSNIIYNANNSATALCDFYQAVSDTGHTRPILIHINFDSLSENSQVCWRGSYGRCALFTAVTDWLNWNVLSCKTTAAAPTIPAGFQDFACLLSFLAAHPATYGNIQDLRLYGASGGSLAVSFMTLKSPAYFLTDGNGNCATSNTTGYAITRTLTNSMIPDITNNILNSGQSVGGLYQYGGSGGQTLITTALGGAPTGTPYSTTAAQVSPAEFSLNAATAHIFGIWGTSDASVPYGVFHALQYQAQVAGFNGVSEAQISGEGHLLDEHDSFCTVWRSCSMAAVNYTSPNCPNSLLSCGPYGKLYSIGFKWLASVGTASGARSSGKAGGTF